MRVEPNTMQGWQVYTAISTASDNAANIYANPGAVGGWEIFNGTAATIYVKLYDKATAPAPASDAALLKAIIGVPAAGRSSIAPGACGITFAKGIGIAIVANAATNDDTNAAAGAVANIYWGQTPITA